jgi:hypothetical protein
MSEIGIHNSGLSISRRLLAGRDQNARNGQLLCPRSISTDHQNWIREANSGKAHERNDDEKEFPKGERVNTD